MTNIQYKIGDATFPDSRGNKIIVHVCNDAGGWGRGFVLAISKRWPQPEMAYRRWYREREQNSFCLGAVQFARVESDIWVANMIGQHGLAREADRPPIRYEAVEAALLQVAEKGIELAATIHMPRIGCGLAGGKWGKIEPIILRTLCAKGVDVSVYDL
jgi:O-acetyl-ADP-ribose deacetylase (regulator of RNase III)